MKALAALALVATCVKAAPHIAIVPIDNPEQVTFIGAVRCDMTGEPYVLVSPALTDRETYWVMQHEARHLSQIAAFGGCRKFMARYEADSIFRLTAESEAYCSVFLAQRARGVTVDPDLPGILWRLRFRYGADFTGEALREAMVCG